jgi:hypothetical protein
VATLLAGCAGVPLMAAGAREAVDAQYEGRYMVLRQSMYFGDFWDNPDVTLLDPKPFRDLTYLLDPFKKPIIPGVARGIIPAGTRVRIQRVEFPGTGSLLGRPLLTPRYNGWVLLRVNHFDVPGVRGFQDRTHVIVLPLGLGDPEQVDHALEPLLGDESVRDWMNRRQPSVRAAIREKRVVVGMTYDEVTSSLGVPDRLERRDVAGKREDTATFGQRTVVLVDDVVTAVP